MKQIGAIILSFEESGQLGNLSPWKGIDGAHLLRELREDVPVHGLVFLSTCNRVELIYSAPDDRHAALECAARRVLPDLPRGVQPRSLRGPAAVRHLLQLAAGLESMVLGETEIRAQLKAAFEEAPALDRRLRLVFQSVLRESREIRQSISLSRLPLSVASLATRRLCDMLGLERKGESAARIAIIGSGPMSQQAARYLSKFPVELVLINRTLSKVASLADVCGARVVRFTDFLERPRELGRLDAVISATSAPEPFITPELLEDIGLPGVVVDMAVPGDVSPDCMSLPGVRFVTMESMREELTRNQRRREEACAEAREKIDEAAFRVNADLIATLSGPVMARLQREVRDQSRQRLTELLDGRLRHLSSRDRRMLYTWAIQANRDLNRLHRRGLEAVLKHYYADLAVESRIESAGS